MQHIDTYDKDRARRARIESAYKKRVQGQMFDPGTNKDNLTGFSTPQEKHGKRPAINSFSINLR